MPPLIDRLSGQQINRPSPHGHRYWFPTTVLILLGSGILYLRLHPDMDRNMRDWGTLVLTLLGLGLLAVWFFLFGRFSKRLRVRMLVGLIAVVAIFKLSLRIDGTTDGRGLPKLVWRWEKHPSSPPPALPASLATEQAATITVPPDMTDVPQFFGPERDGRVRETHLLPDWKNHPPTELWRREIGAGWSSFAIVNGRAYTLEQRGEKEVLSCYEALTGRPLWAYEDDAHFSQWQSGDGPHATPTVDQGHVFAIGATGILNCIDAITGKLVWSRNLFKDYPIQNLTWGISSSPLVFDDLVIVTGGQTPGLNLFAYHRSTGEPAWQAGDDAASYASPILTKLAGRKVILTNNATALTAHDPLNGKLVLNYTWGGNTMPKGAQPVVVDDSHIFLSAGYGMGCQMIQLSPGPDDSLVATGLWRNLKMKNQFTTTIYHEGHLYGLDDGQLACLKADTGERLWKQGKFGSGQALFVDNDLIIIQSEPGPTFLMRLSPDGAENIGTIPSLDSKTWNHPALAGRYLFVRNDREAVCYKLPVRPDSAQ